MKRDGILERLDDTRVAMFWDHVSRPSNGECWTWNGGRSGDGYGAFRIRRFFTTAAHRIAYALTFVQEPGEFQVCHKCDNPLCCNPRHLFLGTAGDNARDKVQKGRARGRFSA